MRYDDLSQADLSTDVTVARADVDGLPNGVMGPAIGNTITGSDTITGQAGADSVANPPATIVAVQGAGASSAEADGSFVVTGQYGVLTIQADGSYSYVRNAGAPDGLDDVFTYTLADAAGQRSSSTLTIELGIQTPSDAASATLSAIPGVVTLPPGVELSDIRVVGRDLVVTLPDGSQMVIPGGAVFVPQLVIGDVEVPASNLAALLIDSEPQPAAGPPLSSGGNFAIDVPPLDPGVPLGDLLPPTELTFIPPEFEEPGQFIDEEPEAGITAAQLDDDEQPGGIAGGVGDDPGGSSDSGILPGSGGDGDLTWDLLTTGAPAGFSYADGPNGSILVFQDGNPNAVLSITLDAATGAYTATQLGPITHPVGSDENNVVITINYTVTDEDGDTAPGSLTINVDDDTPIARDDTDSVPEGADSTDGNVITGTGTTSGASGADSGGADGIPDGVIGIRAGTSGNFTTVTGAGTTVSGTFGDLTIHADGSYTYALHEGTEGGGTDVFTYQIIDGDGDPDTATLTITVPDQNDPPIVDGSTINVSEEGLADGNPDSDGTPDTTDDASVSGTITINDPDGDPVTVTLGIPAGAYTSNGVPIVWAVSPDGHTLTGTAGANLIVTVTIDNTGAYDVVLSGPFDHSDPTIEDALSFTVPVSVDDGTAPPVGTTIVVTVEDDSPEAGVGEFSVPEIVLDESPVGEDEGGDSDPVGRSSVTVDLSGAFVTPADYGADGAGSVAYALVLTGTDVGSGLFALDPLAVDGKGDEILLNQDPVTGVITGSAGGTDYFTISVDATTGEVTFAQTNNVWHADTASDDDTSFLTVDAGVLTLEQTVTDADGDTDSASVDLGDDIFQIEDDGPSLSEVGAGAGVTLDETDAGDITGFPISATSLTAAITAVAAFGTDGAGATSYGLAIVGDGSTSLQTAQGDHAITLVQIDGDTIEGQYADGGTQVAFTIDINADGTITVTQEVPLEHLIDGDTPADHDDTLDLAGLVDATITVTDADGDSETGSAAIGVNIIFHDDGPDAGTDGRFSVPEIVLDESPVGEDEGGDSDPVGRSSVTVDLSGAFVTPADYGADGAGSVAYALVLTGTDVGSGLFALDPLAVDGKGDEILLNQDPVTGVITGSAGGTDYFTISVDATTGEVTFAQTNNVWHADTASDDDTSFLTVDAGVLTLEQTVTDADGDTDSASVDLGDDIFQIEDDGPSLSEVGAGAGVTLDETDAGDITGFPISATSLTAAITAVAAFGTDGAGATSYGLAIVGDGSTSLQTAQGDHAITLVQIDGDTIEGQYADGGTQVAFTIDINADGTITVTQEVPLEHLIDGDTPADHDDTLDLAGLVDATITVTDADGDSETGSAAIGVNIIFHDDGPDAGTDGRFSVPEIVLDESPVGEDEGGDSDPVGRSSVTVDLSGAFVTPADYGADGAGSVAYALVLTGTDVGSGLFALDPLAVDGKGDEILLNQDPVTGVITGSAGGTDYFTISVDATTGEVTFAQTNNVWHADTASDDDTSFLTVDAGVLTLEQTVTDADGDTDSASVDLGDDIFQIEDDGPSLSEVGAGAGVTLDETDAGDITGFPISATSLTAAITAVAAFGTDGAGATSYGLAIVGDGSTSLQTAQGDHAITLVQIDGDTIEGQYADGGTQVAFTIDINADGTITVTQEVPLEHLIDGDTPADHDDTLDLAGLVDATITVTDADGDSETGSAAIGVNIIFHDDGPEAGVDGEFDTPQLVVDESPLGEDEGGDSTPAGVSTASADFSGAFNASVDYGADGAGSFSYALALSADGAGSGLYALGADGNPGPEILLYDNGDGTISGKIGADVYFTISVDASANVSFEQFLNVYHADTTSDDDTSTLEADAGTITLVQSVTDSDGDTDSASVDLSSGVFSIEDDGPTAISPEAVNVEQGGTVTGELDFGDVDGVDDNYGTDGAGTVRFPSTIDGTDSGLESGGDPIIYDLVDDHTLQGKVGNTVIFTITLDPATSEYTVDLDGVIDSFTDIEFSDGSYDFVGGNDPWAGFVPLGQEAAPQDDNSQDLLLTPFSDVGSGNSINGNANSAGVGGGGGGQNIGAGEGIRLDFVTDLTGNPAGSPANYDGNVAQQDHVFDGHYEVNDVSLRFGDGQTDSTISIEAFDADDSNDLVLGNGDLVNITRIVISYDGENQAVTFDPLNLTQTVTVGVVGGLADRQYTVEWIEDSPGVYHVEVTGILDINVRIATHGETTYEALEVQHLSGDDFAITGFGAATQSTEPVDFQVPVEIVDADGDPEAAMLDVTVYAVGDLPAPFAKLSSQSEESSNLLVSNDNIETHKAMNAGNNAIVLGAVAAAGLMSEPAAASSSARVGGELTGEGQEMTARGDSSVDPQLASSTEANAQLISGETKAELSETTDGTSGSEGSEVQSLSVADAQSGTAAEPGNLDQGTDAPQGNSSLAPTTADAVIMPSAEMLAGVGNAEAAEQAQSNQIVGQVLADSLAGGSGQSEIDAALSQLPGDNGAIAGLEQLATQDGGSVPAWHSADLSGFTAANDLLSMEALMLHPDAAPAASS